MGTQDDLDNTKENRANANEEGSPDKEALKALIQEQSAELSHSRAALLQLLAAQTDGVCPDEGATPLCSSNKPKDRKGTDNHASSAVLKQRRQSNNVTGNNWYNQITSRDKIIAELRARNQDLKDDAAALVAEREKLQGFARAEKRLREQHVGLMAAVKSLKAQGEADAEAQAALRQQITDLQAKLKHEVSKTTMHRETQRVLEKELVAKQDVLNEAHNTLSVLHERYTTLTQIMTQATKSTFDNKLSAAAKQADIEAAQSALDQANVELQQLATKCTSLLSELHVAREEKQAAEQHIEEVTKELRELQADKGVGALAARAAEADSWQRKAALAGEKLERMRASYQRARKQHDAMEQRLAESGLTSPLAPQDGRSVVVQMPLTPPTPIDAVLPGAPRHFPANEATIEVPANAHARAEWLNVEVNAIRSRIASLKEAFSGDPAIAALAMA